MRPEGVKLIGRTQVRHVRGGRKSDYIYILQKTFNNMTQLSSILGKNSLVSLIGGTKLSFLETL